ncbi:DUF2062 domain-containing protein [Desulfoluna butyratoxydans]|uniref:DUF2062 domain-containing protein n=1 Tax=Desulfoluna butyratoxydans TaxID=231438 RepID=A0A4U8YHL1_9BACT|nr:DUF2062 domain-containing protein [Desulfoluna butyratoxydans]VFQ43041.1 domain of unknown function duf2062 [Desulfoluna butyratoxydans]
MNQIGQKSLMSNENITYWNKIKKHFCSLLEKIKRLQGNPHYIAMGMAIGVFVGVTPTIPFHTALAIVLAFVLHGSKPAAAIGVWVANPLTIPLFYYSSYKVGVGLFGGNRGDGPNIDLMIRVMESGIPIAEKLGLIKGFLAHHFGVACMMLGGSIVLAVIPTIVTYFLTRKLIAGTYTSVKVISKSRYKNDGNRQCGEESDDDIA